MAAGVSTYGDWLTVVALAVLLFGLTASPRRRRSTSSRGSRPACSVPRPGDRSPTVRSRPRRRLVRAAPGVLTAAIVLARTGTSGRFSSGRNAVPRIDCAAGLLRIHPARHPPDRFLRVNAIYSGLFESSVLVAPASAHWCSRSSNPRRSSRPTPSPSSWPACSCCRCACPPRPAPGAGTLDGEPRRQAATRCSARWPRRSSAAPRRSPRSRRCSSSRPRSASATPPTSAGCMRAVGAGGVVGSCAAALEPADHRRRGISIGFLLEVIPLGALRARRGAASPRLRCCFQHRGGGAVSDAGTDGPAAARSGGVARPGQRGDATAALLGHARRRDRRRGARRDRRLERARRRGRRLSPSAALRPGVGSRIAGDHGVPTRSPSPGHRWCSCQDQTATASRTSFSIGRPTELPHSLHDPS